MTVRNRFGNWRSWLFASWAMAAIVSVGFLMEKHLTAIEPAGDLSDVEAPPAPESAWTVTHILSAGCPCSERTIEGLIGRAPIAGATERYVISGDSGQWAQRFASANKELIELSPESLQSTYQVSGGPFLIIQDNTGAVHYRGGYGARPYLRPDEIQYHAVINQLKQGQDPTLYPAVGCQFN